TNPGDPRVLLDHLLGLHRERLEALLPRNAIERARKHWDLVHSQAAAARQHSAALGEAVAEALARFRDELTAEYLTATREVMRHGAVAAGWRADYEKGLAQLRGLLSLDQANIRLLTALVETAADWFFDCYNNEDMPRLWQQVERFTPFALKLARLVAERPGELAARAALSDFYKFRGFTAEDREARVALYREALHYNPANANVRELL